MNQFLYLYPIKEYLEYEIDRHYYILDPHSKEPFTEKYFSALNEAISLRYREKGFEINWAVFSDRSVFERVHTEETDRIFPADVSFEAHTSESLYPSEETLLDQIPKGRLVVTGFHMWDCVERVARKAHKRGIEVLVDEDLTEFFSGILAFDPERDLQNYPSHNPRKERGGHFNRFMAARKGKPWLWQKY